MITSKRRKLEDYCEEQRDCRSCPLNEAGGHCDFLDEEDTPDTLINELYEMAFKGDTDTCTIKDSGNRTEFETGAVRDIQKGKGRCDLMPLFVVADCFAMVYPNRFTGNIFTELHLFTQTGDVSHLYEALIRPEPYEMWADMFLEVAKHFEEGAEKYGEYNWQKGIPSNRYIDSAVRHYLKWLRGDTDEPHDRAFCWNIICCIWTCENKPNLNTYKENKTHES